MEVEFRAEEVWKDGEKMEKERAGCWAELKKGMQKGYTEKLKNEYKEKSIQSQVFAGQENESRVWLNTIITPQKPAWYTVRLEKGHVVKGNGLNLCWDFEHRM